MTISELGALGEFISSIVVIVTIVYLAKQVKQSQKSMDSNTTAILGASEARGHEAFMSHMQTFFTDGELSDLVVRGLRDFQQLDTQEKVRFGAFCHNAIQTNQMTYMQWLKGLLGDEYWHFSIKYTAQNFYAFPGAQEWWKSQGKIYSNEYRILVDQIISESAWEDPNKFVEEFVIG